MISMLGLDSKKIQQFIYIVFITGIALLFIAKADLGTKAAPEKESEPIQSEAEDMEQKLRQTLRLAEGVGEVRVIINYGTTQAKVLAKDKTEESDDTSRRFEEKVTLGGDGKPVVLRENAREIKGVLIVAQGGGDAKVRAGLISAAQALLGVEPHKIEVLKMKQHSAE